MREELRDYGAGLELLPELVVLSKRDLVPGERADELVAEWSDRLGGTALGVLAVSSVNGAGIEELRRAILEAVPEGGAEAVPAAPGAGPEFEAEHIVYRPEGDQGFDVERVEDGVFEVRGRGIELLVAPPRPREPGGPRLPRAAPGRDRGDRRAALGGVRAGRRGADRRAGVRASPGSAVGPHAKKGPMTVVAKLGSSIVADDDGALRSAVLDSVCAQVAELHGSGENVVLVTSGAIARGMRLMELDRRPSAIDEMQAASAVGQGSLFRAYEERLGAQEVHAAQVLLTSFDMSARMHYLNARQTLRRLLDWRVVPVVNENDTTATDEITFGDNDFLSAQVAILLEARLLVLLTDTPGLHTADPRARRRRPSWSRR